jgi:hypothetical protein
MILTLSGSGSCLILSSHSLALVVIWFRFWFAQGQPRSGARGSMLMQVDAVFLYRRPAAIAGGHSVTMTLDLLP